MSQSCLLEEVVKVRFHLGAICRLAGEGFDVCNVDREQEVKYRADATVWILDEIETFCIFVASKMSIEHHQTSYVVAYLDASKTPHSSSQT